MRRCFYVLRRYDAVKSKVRLLLGEMYGDPIHETASDQKSIPTTTFFPLTGIYGLREDHYCLKDFIVRVSFSDIDRTMVAIYTPGFRSKKNEMYQVISPTVAAYHFDTIHRHLKHGFRRYIEKD